jgi:hypothetical protein
MNVAGAVDAVSDQNDPMGDKVMYLKKLLVAGVALGIGAVAVGQEYFDFGQIRGLPGEPSVRLDLNRAVLGFAIQAARAADPAAADLLANIDGIQVRVYNAIEDADDLVRYLDDATNRLQRDDWQQIVHVQDDGDVRIFMHGTEQLVTGLTAMIVGDEEAVFVSIAGTITPEQVAQLLARVNDGEILESLGGLNIPQP